MHVHVDMVRKRDEACMYGVCVHVQGGLQGFVCFSQTVEKED
jgi:hypothetical protein